MLANYNKYNSIDTFIKIRKEKNGFLKDSDFVCLMRFLEDNIYNILELGLLEDLMDCLLNSIVFDNSDSNLIIDINNIKNLTQEQNVIDIFDFLDTQAICVIVEPNKNMYFGVNYEVIRKEFCRIISPDAFSCLSLYSLVQQKAFVNTDNELLQDDIRQFANEVLISCDFQKNDIIFTYCCDIFDFFNLSVKVYKK